MLQTILATLVSFMISVLSTPLVILLAKKWQLVDDLRKRSHPANTHIGIIPRAGGIPVVLAIIVAIWLFIPINKLLLGILIGAILIVIIGIIDDKYDISPYWRFIFNIAIVVLVIGFGLGIPYVGNPLGGIIRLDTVVIKFFLLGEHKFLLIANLFSIIWIVAMMNFVNWSKGVDGQMPGFVAIAAFFLGILALRFAGHTIAAVDVSMLAFIVAGAHAGFLLFNIYPQKIMPGYGGGALAGYFLGVLSILSWAKLGTLVLVLSIPLTDAIYVILRRLKNRKSPFIGDAGHFHHRLLEIGWGKQRVAVFYWIVSVLFGFSSLFLKGKEKILAFMIVGISLAVFINIANKIKKIQGVS